MVLDRLLSGAAAHGYAATYDAVVSGFEPYEALVDRVAALVARSVEGRPASVLDVASGTGSLAARLVERGHRATGIDAVAPLVAAARRRHPGIAFACADIAGEHGSLDAIDVCVSMHTLYWHPDPGGVLRGCRRALRAGGHAVVAAHVAAPRVVPTFRGVLRRRGRRSALESLRWLVPTALFERARRLEGRLYDESSLARAMDEAGFEVLEVERAFLGDISLLARGRAR